MKNTLLFILAAVVSSCSYLSPANKKDTVKIYLADNALQYSNEMQMRESVQIEKKIEKAVNSNGNKPADVAVLEKAMATRKATSKVLDELSKIRQELIQATGGYVEGDPTKYYKASNDLATITAIMVTDKKGQSLKKMMDTYIDDINKLGPRKYPYFVLDPKDDLRINDPSISENYETYYFENVSLGMALLHLSYVELDVLMIQNSCLKELSDQLGVGL